MEQAEEGVDVLAPLVSKTVWEVRVVINYLKVFHKARVRVDVLTNEVQLQVPILAPILIHGNKEEKYGLRILYARFIKTF